MFFRKIIAGAALALGLATAAHAQPAGPKAPPPETHDWVIRDFRFRSGETLPELKLRYHTLGTPRRDAAGNIVNAVLALHGTGGSGRSLTNPMFANVLFVPGGLLDPAKYFIILPDNIGHGGSSKPSDGLKMKFPKYDYADMVEAQHRLVTEHLGVKQLRLVMGTSMGCMHSFMWVTTWPNDARAAMPLACQSVEIAGRNRLWRKMAIDAIEADPAWAGGNYTAPPQQGLRAAQSLLIIGGSAPIQMQKAMPTGAAVDAFLAKELPARIASADANDLIYQLDSSRTYNPSPDLEKITVPVTWVNSADDFINPPELGIAEREVKRIKQGRFVLIPASDKTRGHGTHTQAALWQDELKALLARSEP